MTARTKRVFVAAVVGLAALLVSAIPLPFADMLLFPGLAFASVFWPQGIHSDSGLAGIGVALFFAFIYSGTAAFWAGVTYAILWRRHRRT